MIELEQLPPTVRLRLAADESGKPGDVDLAQLLASHDCAYSSVQRLLGLEQHPVRLVSCLAGADCSAVDELCHSEWP